MEVICAGLPRKGYNPPARSHFTVCNTQCSTHTCLCPPCMRSEGSPFLACMHWSTGKGIAMPLCLTPQDTRTHTCPCPPYMSSKAHLLCTHALVYWEKGYNPQAQPHYTHMPMSTLHELHRLKWVSCCMQTHIHAHAVRHTYPLKHTHKPPSGTWAPAAACTHTRVSSGARPALALPRRIHLRMHTHNWPPHPRPSARPPLLCACMQMLLRVASSLDAACTHRFSRDL